MGYLMVRGQLELEGWTILVHATAIQHGHDSVAERGSERLIIEAKGAGSSKEGTARFGKLFNSKHVFDPVAKAVLKALRVVADDGLCGAVAFPTTRITAADRADCDCARSPAGGSTRGSKPA
jgi:hypothetical protein